MGKQITLKNAELRSAINSLGELMQYEMSVKVGWNLKKNMTKLQSAFKSFVEFEQELVTKYGIKIDDEVQFEENGQPKIYPANQAIFNKEHMELLSIDNELDILTVKLSDFGDKNIKPYLLFNLDMMIEDDSE